MGHPSLVVGTEDEGWMCLEESVGGGWDRGEGSMCLEEPVGGGWDRG